MSTPDPAPASSLVLYPTEGELPQNSTIRKFRIVRRAGGCPVTRHLHHYRLEAAA